MDFVPSKVEPFECQKRGVSGGVRTVFVGCLSVGTAVCARNLSLCDACIASDTRNMLAVVFRGRFMIHGGVEDTCVGRFLCSRVCREMCLATTKSNSFYVVSSHSSEWRTANCARSAPPPSI